VNCVSQFKNVARLKANCGTQFATKKTTKGEPIGFAFVTLNEKYNGFRKLVFVRNCKFFSAFASSAGQDFAAIGR